MAQIVSCAWANPFYPPNFQRCTSAAANNPAAFAETIVRFGSKRPCKPNVAGVSYRGANPARRSQVKSVRFSELAPASALSGAGTLSGLRRAPSATYVCEQVAQAAPVFHPKSKRARTVASGCTTPFRFHAMVVRSCPRALGLRGERATADQYRHNGQQNASPHWPDGPPEPSFVGPSGTD